MGAKHFPGPHEQALVRGAIRVPEPIGYHSRNWKFVFRRAFRCVTGSPRPATDGAEGPGSSRPEIASSLYRVQKPIRAGVRARTVADTIAHPVYDREVAPSHLPFGSHPESSSGGLLPGAHGLHRHLNWISPRHSKLRNSSPPIAVGSAAVAKVQPLQMEIFMIHLHNRRN